MCTRERSHQQERNSRPSEAEHQRAGAPPERSEEEFCSGTCPGNARSSRTARAIFRRESVWPHSATKGPNLSRNAESGVY